MKDAFTNWRTSEDGDLTATETTAGMQIGAAPVGGFSYKLHVPAQDASGDTLAVTFEESDTVSGTYRTCETVRPQVTGTGTAGAPIDLEGHLHNTLAWVRAVFTVTGSTPNFGAVHLGLDSGAHRNALLVGDATSP